MCGILGLLAPGSQPATPLQLRLLAHRGPNDEGCYADADVFLGARRLSIIDVAGGHQPLANETGTVWAVQNGEIYNYLDVRDELVARGHIFRTRSDTEVIVHAYEEWGAECPKHLRGIFAFAVWDAPQRRLLLARDRFGVKPLYYCRLPSGGLAFASEIRPLLSFLPDGPCADLFALRALFSVGFIPTPHTAFGGLHKLPAAHSLGMEAGRVRVEKYWDVLPHPLLPTGRSETGPGVRAYVETFKQHLTRAVAEQRMSEAPLGALISGGIDSSSIAALLQAQSSERLHTFNIGFERARYDETRYAELAARHIGAQHHQIVFREADFDRYPEVMARLEEPQCSATALPLYLLYEACRQAGLTVILTGEGSDELLGGYHWFRGDAHSRRLFWLPRLMRETLAAAPLAVSEASRAVLRRAELDPVARYALWHSVGSVAGLLSPEVRRADGLVDHWRGSLDGAMRGLDPFRQFQYLEAHTRLVDFINFEVDRMSMAHSIEARVPFLDHELWEFAASLPSQILLDGPEPKQLLREAMRSYLPPEILARRKWGLAAPYSDWLRRPRLPDWAEEVIFDSALTKTGYFNVAAVKRLRAEHQSGRRNHARLLMGVLSTQLWHRQFIGRG